MEKNNILTFLKEHKVEYHNRFGVKKIALFGSYAREEASDNSDIDILVDMKPTFKNFFTLKRELENSLGKNVDLGIIDNLRLLVKESIAKEIIYV